MLVVGTKIRQKKESPHFSFGNTVLRISNIFGDGTVIVECADLDGWIGIMSCSDINQYFEVVADKPKRKWGKWTWSFADQCWYCTNGKTVKAKYGDYVGKASCSPDDSFDLHFGIAIAFARAKKKCKRDALLEAIKACDQATEEFEAISEYVNWLIS